MRPEVHGEVLAVTTCHMISQVQLTSNTKTVILTKIAGIRPRYL